MDIAGMHEKIRRDSHGCWIWEGARDEKGYGRVTFGGKENQRVHRVMFQHVKGSIDDTVVVDHLCSVRACCNPDHLEAVSGAENTKRGARFTGLCRNGIHPMVGDNVIERLDRPGRQECRACRDARRP